MSDENDDGVIGEFVGGQALPSQEPEHEPVNEAFPPVTPDVSGLRRPPLPPGFRLPPQTVVKHPPTAFPADLEAALNRARESGNYHVIVVVGKPDGDLSVTQFRSAPFNVDWLLRGWQTAGRSIIDGSMTNSPVIPNKVQGG